MIAPRWIFAEEGDAAAAEMLAKELALKPFFGRFLVRMGCATLDKADLFLQPKLRSLRDPFLLPDMHLAVERLMQAFANEEKILLYGDYDVDGVTSLTLLDEILRAYGAAPVSFVPARLDEGYGLSMDGLERCLSEFSPQLLIAVDCGTGSVDEVAALRQRGIDVIILDHHECQDRLPDCAAVVNPKRGEDFHYLCSVGIVFKLCHALLKTRPIESFDLRDHLDLVAVGTVCDLVPLQDENRILVRNGIQRLENTLRPGLRKLMEITGVNAPIRTSDIGYRLGPRINASGRLGSALESLELLRTCDPARAHELAHQLDAMNRERQDVERETFRQAEEHVKASSNLPGDAAIVVAAKGWHLGVIGIVASRLMRSHHRPTLVIGFDDHGWGKGSGRSIEGLSLVETLAGCSDLLEQFGGHEMAAGLSLHESQFAEFRLRFLELARQRLDADQLRPCVRLDGELGLCDVGLEVLQAHDMLQPFGMGNPQPVFCARGVTPASEPRVLKEKHLLFDFREGQQRVSAIYFGGANSQLPQPPWDLAFQIERNEFRGQVSAQVQVQAVRSAC